MGLYSKILATPFIFDRVRPFLVGGIDMSPAYDRLRLKKTDTLLDIGCGTGDALRYLGEFDTYVGYDTNEVAVRAARQRYGDRPGVRFECRACNEDDVRGLSPTCVVLVGLLHHLPDDETIALLRMLRASSRLERIVALDIVFVRGEMLSNFLARLDRGRYCRESSAYESLAVAAGFCVTESTRVRSHPVNGRAIYHVMVLEADRPADPG